MYEEVKTTVVMKLTIAMLLMVVLNSTARAESIYRLNASTTEGVDLTAKDGFYADRMEGPSSADITFSGELVVDPSISAANPFRLIGLGKQITVNKLGSGFHTLPLMLYNADGVTATSTLKFDANVSWASSFCANEFLDIGAHNVVTFGYGTDSGQVTLNSREIRIHDGGSLKTSYRAYFGYNRPISISLDNGGEISVKEGTRIGRQNATTASLSETLTAFVGITNAMLHTGGVANMMVDVEVYDEPENCRVVIGGDGVFSAEQACHHGGGGTRFVFDGGKFVSANDSTKALFNAGGTGYSGYPHSRIWLEGVNGHPVTIEIGHDRNLATASGASSISSDRRKVDVLGDGGFTKRGAGKLLFNKLNGKSVCTYTGPTTILGGGIVVADSEFKPGRGELAVSDGAFLDLNGFDAEFSGATGKGSVLNSSASASTFTLDYGDKDSALSIAVKERISIIKRGTGTLTVSDDALNNTCDITIEEGTVVFSGDSSSYGTVTIKAGATLDIRGVKFSCGSLVREQGGTILPKPGFIFCVY